MARSSVASTRPRRPSGTRRLGHAGGRALLSSPASDVLVIFASIRAARRLSPSATAARSSNTLHAPSAEGARCGKLSGPNWGPRRAVGSSLGRDDRRQAAAVASVGDGSTSGGGKKWALESVARSDSAARRGGHFSFRVNPRRRSVSLDRLAVRAIASTSPTRSTASRDILQGILGQLRTSFAACTTKSLQTRPFTD